MTPWSEGNSMADWLDPYGGVSHLVNLFAATPADGGDCSCLLSSDQTPVDNKPAGGRANHGLKQQYE